LSKAEATYWTRYPATARRGGAAGKGKARRSVSRWLALAVVVGTMAILCVAVNFRAFLEMNRQATENRRLKTEIQQLSSASVSLQEEVKNLNGDPKTIEREARKIGMGRPNEKILVPMN